MTRTKRIASARILAPALLAVVVLAVWQLVTATGLAPAVFLPAPGDLAVRFARELGRPVFLGATGTTLVEALAGSLLAVIVAVPLGYLVARVRWIRLAASPYLAASQAIPAIAVAPLLAIWIGYGLTPIAVLCAITAFFPMLVTTVLGVRGIDRELLDAATLDGAGTWSRLLHIEAPLALPSIIAGVRAGAALSITGAVVGEFTMGGRGLGMLLTLYRDANDTEGLFATLLMLVLLAVTLFGLLGLVARLAPGAEDRRPSPWTALRRAATPRAAEEGAAAGADPAGSGPAPRRAGPSGSSDRTEQPDLPHHVDRPERLGRAEGPERSEGPERAEPLERPDRVVPASRSARPNRRRQPAQGAR